MPLSPPGRLRGRVLEQRPRGPGVFALEMELDEAAPRAAAGQFVMVRCGEGADPLLRRAFSIHDLFADRLVLLYKVVGRGTRWLAARRAGDAVEMLGPLGRGFAVPADGEIWLVAGGMGLAPFLLLARAGRRDLRLFYGTRTEAEQAAAADLRAAGFALEAAVEEGGGPGFRGTVTDLLACRLAAADRPRPLAVLACGPGAMLEAAARSCAAAGVPCQVCLEAEMACGVGACAGCVVRTRDGYRRVCRDGPVFDAAEIVWSAEGRT